MDPVARHFLPRRRLLLDYLQWICDLSLRRDETSRDNIRSGR